jgi:NAD-dependent deacetylase
MPHGPQDLAAALARAGHAVVLTGAGVSTESGIPDFRSADGLWERYDPMEVASMSTFLSEPQRFWSFHRPRIDMLAGAEPNAAHRAVACDARVSMDELVARADAADDGVPRCGCGFPLKSGVVLFGEALPGEAIEAAYAHAERADLMLVIGSSLLVAPVSELPRIVLERGGTLAILTESETPYDEAAQLRLRGRAAGQMTQTLAALDRLR